MRTITNAIEFMAFCGAAALAFRIMDAALKSAGISERGQTIIAWICVAATIALFAFVFDIQGLPPPSDWSDKARRP